MVAATRSKSTKKMRQVACWPIEGTPRGLDRSGVTSVSGRIGLMLGDKTARVDQRWAWLAEDSHGFIKYIHAELRNKPRWYQLPESEADTRIQEAHDLILDPAMLRARACEHYTDNDDRNARTDMEMSLFTSLWLLDFILDAFVEEVIGQDVAGGYGDQFGESVPDPRRVAGLTRQELPSDLTADEVAFVSNAHGEILPDGTLQAAELNALRAPGFQTAGMLLRSSKTAPPSAKGGV